ncbi:MAG: Ppx/GppA phosphatase family protein [Planctomycetota bacterium]|nr:Ppx/GppA phosphatase family protein [Planctomycetota bacterium]
MSPPSPAESQLAAAVDLGSNSFHMVVARTQGGRVSVIDRLRERVRLGAGLSADGRLDPEALKRALACLRRFRQRLAEVPSARVRAVATDAFRRAHASTELRERAVEALGHPIEVVAGREEARLVYLGVRHDLAGWGERMLVVDVGGGSTEVAAGTGRVPELGESLRLGSLRWSEEYFAGGVISAKSLELAVLAAMHEVEPVAAAFRRLGRARAVGSSGTAQALDGILRKTGLDPRGLSRAGLHALCQAVVKKRALQELELPGLEEARRPNFLGGLAILTAIAEVLRIERFEVSEGALREGVLMDLLGRLRHRGDPRRSTVEQLARRCEVDPRQATRVRSTAAELFEAVRSAWKLDAEEHLPLLEWAAELHEAGFFVGHGGYHRHGRYLIENADLVGFSRTETAELGWLVWKHRRTLPLAHLEQAPPARREALLKLALLLRLAARLHRARGAASPAPFRVEARAQSLSLMFPSHWIDEHPLTAFDLSEEARDWKGVGFTLRCA